MGVHDFESAVLVGNTVFYPTIIRAALKKLHYFLLYLPDLEKAILKSNSGKVAGSLFEIRGISYESAVKLAEGLGLKGDGATPTIWRKCNPFLRLHHDGSDKAEEVRLELLRLGIPHQVEQARDLALQDSNYVYKDPNFPVDRLKEIIRNTAEHHREELETTP